VRLVGWCGGIIEESRARKVAGGGPSFFSLIITAPVVATPPNPARSCVDAYAFAPSVHRFKKRVNIHVKFRHSAKTGACFLY
jgi:hypothetical protein